MYRSHVLVCGGTGCTSSGSETLISLLQEELKKNGLENEVAIVKTGCHGLCAQGPVMVIYPDATFYSMVKPEDIPEIVSEHLLKGRVVTRLLYVEDGGKAKALKDTDFYRLQHRVALRNCGIINPESIDEYIGTGGYEALGRVLTEMSPDDVIETILMGMLYGAQIQTMMPKLHSTNFEGMELIRPLYLIREADIIHWRDYNNLAFIQCACRLTESCASCGGTEKGSKRGEIKQLIKDLTKVSPYIEKNIFRSVENVNLDTVIAYKQYGVKHNFLERYDEMGRLNGASGSQTADNKEME